MKQILDNVILVLLFPFIVVVAIILALGIESTDEKLNKRLKNANL